MTASYFRTVLEDGARAYHAGGACPYDNGARADWWMKGWNHEKALADIEQAQTIVSEASNQPGIMTEQQFVVLAAFINNPCERTEYEARLALVSG